MRRISLSAKLFIAVLPLLVAVGALLASSMRSDFDDVAEVRRGAQLGSTWELLITSIRAVESEQAISAGDDQAAIDEARRSTDSTLTGVSEAVREIGGSEEMVLILNSATGGLGNARVGVEAGDKVQVSSTGIGTTTGTLIAVREFDSAQRDLIELGRLLPDEAGDLVLGRELYAVGTLAATEQTANDLVQTLSEWPESGYLSSIEHAAALGDTVVANVSEFQNIAPPEWQEFGDQWAQIMSDTANDLDDIVAQADRGEFVAFEPTRFVETVADIATVRDQLASEIVSDANSKADSLQRTTILEVGITLAAVLLAALMAFFLTRSITRRVRAVADKAREVANVQLPALVSALADPRGRTVIPEVAPIENAGSDELGELADAFNMVQSTLVDVAHQQVEVLQRGVSNIFVTMARRTRSLIDRQLALLDKLEAEVDDPNVLANYYQLDHLATRMRRNSESLLVLASAETRRKRAKATEVDDVVRAAIGEVDDYRRIDVLNLDQLQVRGAVVADISHLLAELLDNASSFSPPETRVTVSGRYAGEEYLISIADEGVGIGADRLDELNDILAHPPVVGLSVEPTLGMSVVSLLANKHGVKVQLVPSSPGLLVEVVLPASIHEVSETTGMSGAQPTSNGHERVASDSVVDQTGVTTRTDTFVPDVVTVESPTATIEPTFEPEPAVAADPTFETEWNVQGDQAVAVDPTFETEWNVQDDQTVAADPTFEPEWNVQDDQAVAADPTFEPEWNVQDDQTVAADPTFEPEWTYRSEPAGESITAEATPTTETTYEPAWSAAQERTVAPDPVHDAVPDEPEHHPAAGLGALGFTAPLANDRLSGEFDRPPAPPSFGTQPESRPFTDPTARPIPARRTESERDVPTTTLPSRTRGTGPDGPDRLAHLQIPAGQPLGHAAPNPPSDPNTLKAALTAFEAGRAGARPDIVSPTATLPTRDPGSAFDHDEVTTSTTQSRLDPEAIRERLRSFRKEFQLGRDGEAAAGHDGDQNDLGGDR